MGGGGKLGRKHDSYITTVKAGNHAAAGFTHTGHALQLHLD